MRGWKTILSFWVSAYFRVLCWFKGVYTLNLNLGDFGGDSLSLITMIWEFPTGADRSRWNLPRYMDWMDEGISTPYNSIRYSTCTLMYSVHQVPGSLDEKRVISWFLLNHLLMASYLFPEPQGLEVVTICGMRHSECQPLPQGFAPSRWRQPATRTRKKVCL